MESQTSALPLGYARHFTQHLSLYSFDFVLVNPLKDKKRMPRPSVSVFSVATSYSTGHHRVMLGMGDRNNFFSLPCSTCL